MAVPRGKLHTVRPSAADLRTKILDFRGFHSGSPRITNDLVRCTRRTNHVAHRSTHAVCGNGNDNDDDNGDGRGDTIGVRVIFSVSVSISVLIGALL